MRGHWLCSDFSSRDPKDDLSDIDGGKFLDALQDLPQSLRQMLQEGDIHIELQEYDGQYRIAKVIKRRESEYLQGSEQYFVYADDGARIPLSEEEYDKLLGLQHNPDDVFNEASGVELQTLDHEYTAPMDKYDVLYDATDFIRQADRLLQDEEWQAKPAAEKQQEMAELANELIYSADWFPYPADKKLHSTRAREIAHKIESGITKSALGKLIGSRDSTNDMTKQVNELRARARDMKASPEKARLLIQANETIVAQAKWRRNYRGPLREALPDSDRKKLWQMWQEQEIKTTGQVKLMPWQFERLYRAKLERLVVQGQLSKKDAAQKLSERMEALFKKTPQSGSFEQQEAQLPAWLLSAKPQELVTVSEDEKEAVVDWPSEATYLSLLEDEDNLLYTSEYEE